MPHKDPEANRAYQREWATRKRRARGQTPNRFAYGGPFWERVAKGLGCWTWQGAKTSAGYGHYRGVYAHRVAYAEANGPIPDGLFVLHHCDNPPCVRPDHLFLGSNRDNILDMLAKDRHVRSLAVADVVDIKRSLARGESRISLARRYGVDRHTIGFIATGRTWGWLVVEPTVQLDIGLSA